MFRYDYMPTDLMVDLKKFGQDRTTEKFPVVKLDADGIIVSGAREFTDKKRFPQADLRRAFAQFYNFHSANKSEAEQSKLGIDMHNHWKEYFNENSPKNEAKASVFFSTVVGTSIFNALNSVCMSLTIVFLWRKSSVLALTSRIHTRISSHRMSSRARLRARRRTSSL